MSDVLQEHGRVQTAVVAVDILVKVAVPDGPGADAQRVELLERALAHPRAQAEGAGEVRRSLGIVKAAREQLAQRNIPPAVYFTPASELDADIVRDVEGAARDFHQGAERFQKESGAK